MRTIFRNRPLCASWLAIGFALAVLVVAIPAAVSQDAPSSAVERTPESTAEIPDKASDDPVAREMVAEFNRLSTAWREELAAIRAAQIRFHNGTQDTEQEYRESAREHQAIARERFAEMLDQAVKMLEYDSDDGAYLKAFMAQAVGHRGHVDWYEGLARPSELLEEFLAENAEPEFFSVAGRAQVVAGNFEKARTFLIKAMRTEKPLDCDIRLLNSLDALATDWEQEQSRLANDPDDLPLVELNTTRGRIVVELFEEQAPNTVANFIQLVEQGFYDELPFYQVLEHLFAMTGDPYGDGTGSSGSRIPDEADHPDARSALRGSLVMAKLPIPNDPQGRTVDDSASSQFMILLLPLHMGEGKYTSFGRVVEGLSAVSYFTRIDPSKKTDKNAVQMPPDRILSATVIRKRDHAYDVNYVEEN